MGIAEEQRALERTYRSALPQIVEYIESDTDRYDATTILKETYGIDEKTAFRWLQITEEELESARKRGAVMYLLILWIAGIVVTGIVVLWIIGLVTPRSPLFWLSLAVALLGIGTVTIRLRGLRHRVFQKWMTRESSDQEA